MKESLHPKSDNGEAHISPSFLTKADVQDSFVAVSRLITVFDVAMGLVFDSLVQLRYNAQQLFPPFISVKFGWTISQVSPKLLQDDLVLTVPGRQLAFDSSWH